MKSIKAALNNLGKKVEATVDGVNSGGCCVFAAEVAQYLSKLVPVQIKVVAGWCNNTPIDIVRSKVSNNTPSEWNRKGLDFYHVVIQFELNGNLHIYDSNGVVKYSDFESDLIPGSLTLEEASELAGEARGWNSRFERDQIPRVRRLVREAFEPLLAK